MAMNIQRDTALLCCCNQTLIVRSGTQTSRHRVFAKLEVIEVKFKCSGAWSCHTNGYNLQGTQLLYQLLHIYIYIYI